MDTFTIQTRQGWQAVRGYRLTEHFAAHRLKASELWKVTHLPTGMLVGPLPRTLRAARRMAEALEAVALDWGASDFQILFRAVWEAPEVHEAVRAAFVLGEEGSR